MPNAIEGVKYPREIPSPEGFPEGWRSIEQAYGKSSKSAGKTYIRWTSLDGRHKLLSTPKAVFQAHCGDGGGSWEDMFARFEQARTAKGEARRQETLARQEAEGKLKGERREAMIRLCRKELGPLNGDIVFAFPGWKTEWQYQPNCDQIRVVYFTDEKTSDELGWTDDQGVRTWALLKDLEAAFGGLLVEGGRRADIVRAMYASGKKDESRLKEVRALGGPAAREIAGTIVLDPSDPSTYQYLLDGGKAVAAPRSDMRKRKEPPVQEVPPTKKVFPAQPSLSTKEEWQATTDKFRKLLMERRFPEHTQFLTIQEVGAESGYSAKLRGVYFQKTARVSGRSCFQKLLHAPEASAGFCGDGVFLFWSRKMTRWQICTTLCDDNGKRCFAFFVSEDQPSDVTELKGSWRVRRSDASEGFVDDGKLRVRQAPERKMKGI